MSNANLTYLHAQARTQALTVDSHSIHLDISEAENSPTFQATSTITVRSTSCDIVLDYLGESVDTVEVQGVAHSVDFDGAHIRLTLPDHDPDTTYVVKVSGHSSYSRSGQGLHRFTDPSDNATYVYSHLEPSDARRVFPCFDQPDLKARFHVSMTVPDGWVALSNQPETHVKAHTHFFAPTPPLSTYLTAFAAGPYVATYDTWTSPAGLSVELGVWVRASMAEFVDAEILEITKQGMDFFDAHYGFEYPWGKYDSIFVPEYNLGAMENPGLVTFTESYIFRSHATDAQHAGRANTILHEMSHMWFGDLVTPRWWDDLWLKESFAEFMGADASVAATRFRSAWVNFAGVRKNWAYMQDQLPTTHPIKADIPDVDAARQNFDGITYAKGAAVLKQLVHFVGRDNFYAAAREYFRTYAFSCATFDDFLQIVKKFSEHDLDEWARKWLLTCGPDRLSPRIELVDGYIHSLHIDQVADTPRPHRLTVSLWNKHGSQLLRSQEFDVTVHGQGALVAEATGCVAPDVVLVNDYDHTYAVVGFDARSLDTLAECLSEISDELSRAVVWTSLWNMTRDAQLDVARFVQIAVDHGAAESNPSISTQIFGNAVFAASNFLPPAARGPVCADLAAKLWALVHSSHPGSDVQLVLLRAFIAAATVAGEQFASDLRGVLSGAVAGVTVDADVRWRVFIALSAMGQCSVDELDQERVADHTLDGQVRYLQARYSVPELGVKDEIFDLVMQPGAYSNDEVDALISAYNAPVADAEVDHCARFFQWVETIWSQHPIEIANRLIRGLFPKQPESDQLCEQLLARPLPGALSRVLLECQDHLRRSVRAQRFNA
ncbi:aminopeptidase N [Corynebacterium felinum]|uniref:Aminopeptidase N n=1 Tax=Corynebacterium felinum TaxID=131318 RepID=A0ABU2B5X2_9CORY|nr:aminopeptidase N [Corynebacterium felinum]MDF5821501.1 aminopeptidase N [Corynebacterium felinum]MDR7354020.1 aminopeptidase N [Corynebacterium felinum]WJY96194.1 Aminopeptidase N [Corynebacterium felinum]